MPKFSESSIYQLSTCDERLRKLFYEVIKHVDRTIIQGHRSLEEQKKAYESGASKLLSGKHNTDPSLAVDAAPYIPGKKIPWPEIPKDWGDKVSRNTYIANLNQFYYFSGIVMGIATEMKLPIRWGGDWTRDNDVANDSFLDLVHYEIDEQAWTIK